VEVEKVCEELGYLFGGVHTKRKEEKEKKKRVTLCYSRYVNTRRVNMRPNVLAMLQKNTCEGVDDQLQYDVRNLV
jgi:hypothetical protein